MKVLIQDSEHFPCRLAFAQHLFEAGTVQGEGEPAYSVTALVPPNHPALKEIIAAENAVGAEKWGTRAPAILAEIRANNRDVAKPGDLKASYDGFPGNEFISCRSKARPTVIDRDRSPLVAADGRPYSGCYANVMIEVWAQDNAFGKRLNAQLLGVQFSEDGDAFSAGAAPANPDDFADLSAEATG